MAEDEHGSMSVSGGGIGSGVDMSGNSIENSTSASENGAVNSTSMSGNGPVGAGEGSEGAFGAKVGHEEGFGEKAQDGALEGTEKAKQAGKASKKAYVGVIVVLMVVILAAVGITIAVIWGSKELVTEVVESEKPVEKDEIEEMSLDDEVVQKVYGEFDGTRVGFNSFYRTELGLEPDEIFGNAVEGQTTGVELAKIGVALGNTTSVRCLATIENGGLGRRYGERFDWVLADSSNVYRTCYNGTDVKNQLLKIFGESFEFYPVQYGMNNFGWESALNTVVNGMFAYAYDPEFDEFYRIPDGTEGRTTMGALYKAEQRGDELNLYEVRAIMRCRPAVNDDGSPLGTGSFCTLYDIENGNEIVEFGGEDSEITAEDMVRDREKYPKYKWTFRKNEEGNYIFEGLEKVN